MWAATPRSSTGCSASRRLSSSGATAASCTSRSGRSTRAWWTAGSPASSRPLLTPRGWRGRGRPRTPLPRAAAPATCASPQSSRRRVARRGGTNMRWRGLVIAALAWCSVAGAPAVGQAPDSSLEAKVRDVAATLRCPVCQNLSIQDSPSQLAQDMKRLVRERLAAGETPAQVHRYFVSRYGEWVLLKPGASGIDLSVWALPLLALLGGGVVVWRAVRRWVRQGGAITAPAISPATPPEELRTRRAAVRASRQDLHASSASGRPAASGLRRRTQRDAA